MSNLVQPQPEDFANVEDYFVALDEYYAATLYVGMILEAA